MMAQSSASARGETFACIMFSTLDFFAATTGELNLAVPNVPSTMGAQHACSTKSKAEKRRLKRYVAAIKRCLNRHTTSKVAEAPSSTLVAVIGHQPTYVLDLLEDDSSHDVVGAKQSWVLSH